MARTGRRLRGLKILLILAVIFILGLVALYYTVQSPRFLRFLVNRLNQSISGDISYDTLNFDLDGRHVEIKNLLYKNMAGETIVSLDWMDLHFSPVSALRARLDITGLKVHGLTIDQSKEETKSVPSTWRSTLRLILKRVSIQDSLLERIKILLRNGDEFNFDQATVKVSKQILSRQKVDFWVNESTLKPGNLEIRSSTLSFQGEVTFPLLKDFSFLVDKAEGKLTLSEISVNELPATSLVSDFFINGDTLSLKNGVLNHADGVIDLDIDYTPAKKAHKLHLKTARPFPLSSLPKVGKELLETFDRFEMELNTDLTGYRLSELTGDVDLKLKTLGNTANALTPENSLELTGKLQKGVLQLKKFLIQSAKTTVTATGSVDFPGKKLDTAVDAKGFDLQTLLEAITDLDLRAYADAKGTIKGDFKSPNFVFTATGREAAYSFLNFGDVAGTFKIENGVLTFDGGKPAGPEGSAKVEVRTENIFKKEKHTKLKTEYSGLDVSKLVDNPDLKGKVSGSFEMEDTWTTSPDGKLVAKIDDFFLLDFHLGEVNAEGKLGNRKFTIFPVTFQPVRFDKVAIPRPAVFTFDDKGLKLEGEVLPGAQIAGHFTYNTKTFFIDAIAKNLDLRPLLATLSLNPQESYADGVVKMAIGLENSPTRIDIKASRLLIPLEDGEIREAEPIDITIAPPRVIFNRVKLRSGQGSLTIGGQYVMDGNSSMTLNGKVDLEILKMFPKWFREGDGLAAVDLKFGGNFDNPQVTGDITFDDADIVLRTFRGRIEGLSGKLKLTGNAVEFEKFHGSMAEGDIILDGSIGLKDLTPSFYDLKIQAREATLSEPGAYRLVFSGDLAFKGPAEGPTLSGDVFITDGKYIRNFNITELILKPESTGIPEPPSEFMEKLKLDLRIKSPGELAIKNNVAQMYMQSDLRVTGSANKPVVGGALEILDGEFHYFKIDFQNARGTIDFRNARPYVDVTANKEFVQSASTVNITVTIKGFTDNLQINFTSDSGLERRDIISLIFTGSLGGGTSYAGTQLAGSVLASQLTSLLQSTLGKSANLDVIRLEASETGTSNFSTLVVGKKLTRRLSLEFKTDLGIEDPLQGVQMEYLLLDNFLVKASQLTDGSFNFNFTLRWKSF